MLRKGEDGNVCKLVHSNQTEASEALEAGKLKDRHICQIPADFIAGVNIVRGQRVDSSTLTCHVHTPKIEARPSKFDYSTVRDIGNMGEHQYVEVFAQLANAL